MLPELHVTNRGEQERGNMFRGTQRIVSVNYLFGRPLIPSDFLNRIVTSHFRDMRHLMSVVFGWSKMSFWVGTVKRSAIRPEARSTHVLIISKTEIFFPFFEKICVHTDRIKIVFALPHVYAKTILIR